MKKMITEQKWNYCKDAKIMSRLYYIGIDLLVSSS